MDKLLYMPQTKGIAIGVEIYPMEDFHSYRNRLRVVLLNQFSNGIKYGDASKEKPAIQIKFHLHKGTAHLSVKDNGVGIGEEHQDKLLPMFYRDSENKSGSGLSLHIAKENITKMKGTISLLSRCHEGCEFIICLPNLKGEWLMSE